MTAATHQVTGLSFTPEQLARRRLTLGASEIPVVAGLVPQKSPIALWMEKRGLVPSFEGNEFTEWGTRLEAVIADKYAEVRGVRIYTCDTVIHKTEPWMSATPDRYVDQPGDPETAVIDRGLEVKCRGEYRGDEWGEPGTDEVPHDVAIQCHWSMLVTGLRRWDVATLIGGNKFRMYELFYDAEVADTLLAIGREFWFDYVLAGVQPPIDGSGATQALLKQRFRSVTESLRAATPEEAAWLASLREVREYRKHIEGREDELKNLLMNAIGASAGLTAPDGSRVTWTAPVSGGVSWKNIALALERKLNAPKDIVPALVAEFTSEPVRRFVPTFPKV